MRNKWLILTLAASLVVNLVLVGFVVGRLSSGFTSPPGFFQTAGLPQLLKFMNEGRRHEVLPDMNSNLRDLRPTLHSLRRAQKHIFRSITADPFEAASLQAALADFRGKLDASQVKSHQTFIKVVARLTPDERRLLSQAMRSRRGPRPNPPQR
jgi:uncharacterized membrane protein